MSPEPFLPYGRQCIDQEDVDAVVDVLTGDWLTTGPTVERFEGALAEQVNAPYAIACSSGTAALHLAALAQGIGPGYKVVVPSITFVATANCARYVGADVIFADVDADSGCLTPEHLKSALEAADGPVAAVLPVHLAGQSPDIAEIARIAKSHGAVVIEDACHAVGGQYLAGNDKHWVGSCAHSAMTVFSFHPVKTIAMGEGGAITCKDERTARALSTHRSHGLIRDVEKFMNVDMAHDVNGAANPWYHEMQEPGFNYRASDIHCALAFSQLQKLQRFVETRRQLMARYDELLPALSPIVKPLARLSSAPTAWHLCAVLIDFAAAGKSRAKVMDALRTRGIGSQVHYIPVHRQPYYAARHDGRELPGADRYYERCLSLPLFASMTESDVVKVVATLREVLEL
jgi:UDP-4-amino-4,6-dideoxy-N-acetyl-beta-L-altrosamine transaminase